MTIQKGMRVKADGKVGDLLGWESGERAGIVLSKSIGNPGCWQIKFEDGGIRRRHESEIKEG